MVRRALLAAAAAAALTGAFGAPAVWAAGGHPGFVLSTTRPGGPGFAPSSAGNAHLAGRQPADGQGFAIVTLPGDSGTLPTQSEVQGLFAVAPPLPPPGFPPQPPVERRAALPAWSTLAYDDGSGPYALARGRVRDYRQSLDLLTGTLTTRLVWTSPAGREVLLRYDVTPDRVHRHAAMVRLTFVPRFAGSVTVTDALDGRAADLLHARRRGRAGDTQWLDLVTDRLGLRATEASTLTARPAAAVHGLPAGDPLSARQAVRLRVVPGHRYVVTKAVGVAVATDSADPHAAAVAAARQDARLGYARMRRGSDAAWRRLWASDIEVRGDRRLQAEVRASLFALLASVRDDTPWAPSPGGLSSDGYNGHVFWDSETWMYPTLLATEPAIARQLLAYREHRLAAAYRLAARTGFAGARFPWESGFSGLEETPAFADTGKLEVHISADIALAVWQYWLETGYRRWLAADGWPVLRGIADFWVSRASRNADGSFSIRDVIPPDEYVEHVTDSAYTNVAARNALRFAIRTAGLLGRPAPAAWGAVARGLRVPFDSRLGIHPEYAGYPGNAVKQADVTLLAYPWENPQPAAVTRRDLTYYVPRTDPGGPSMTDAVSSIVASQLRLPGCPAFTFTRRSIDPFMRAPYFQFSEARTGGAFTFTTGAGGFLQEFLYGYSGLRWRADALPLAPSLPPQLAGITLHAVHWRGRVVAIAIGPRSTTATLRSGAAMPVVTPQGRALLAPGRPLTVPTARPDLTPTADIARCRPVAATPATAEPPEAADDGLVASQWIGPAPRAALRVDLGAAVPLGRVTVVRNPVTTFAATTAGGIGQTKPTKSAGERVEASLDGVHWRTLAVVANPHLVDRVAAAGRARFVRLVALGATPAVPLIVGELQVERR